MQQQELVSVPRVLRHISIAVSTHPSFFPVEGEEPVLDIDDEAIVARVTVRPAGSKHPQTIVARGSTPAEAGQNLIHSLDVQAQNVARETLMMALGTLEEGIAKLRLALDAGQAFDTNFLEAATTVRQSAGRYAEFAEIVNGLIARGAIK